VYHDQEAYPGEYLDGLPSHRCLALPGDVLRGPAWMHRGVQVAAALDGLLVHPCLASQEVSPPGRAWMYRGVQVAVARDGVLVLLCPALQEAVRSLVSRHRDVQVVLAPDVLCRARQAGVLRDRVLVYFCLHRDVHGAALDGVRFPADAEACRAPDGFRVCPADYRYCLDVHETRVADERRAEAAGATLAASAADNRLGQTIRLRYAPTKIPDDFRDHTQAPTQPSPIPTGTRFPASLGSSSFQSSSLPKR
jgi:hypothetical protein